MNPLPLVDLHEDISYYYVSSAAGLTFPVETFSDDLPGRHGDIPKFKRAHVAIVFSSIYCLLQTLAPQTSCKLSAGYGSPEFQRAYAMRGAPTNALEHIKVYYALEELHGESLRIVRQRKDIDDAIALKSIGLLIALEGAYSIEDVYDLRLFYNMGLRSLQLAWNFDSRYCASCMSKKDFGLTGEGEDLIRECNRLGLIIDLAHASPKTHLAVTKMSRLPVINSHSNAKALHNIARNLDTGAFESVKKNGGVVGVIFGELMTGGKKTIEDLANHVFYIYENFGPDVLAVGSDYFGLIDCPAVKGLEDITNIDKLFEILRKRGMSESDIEKLAFNNALRVINQNAERWA